MKNAVFAAALCFVTLPAVAADASEDKQAAPAGSAVRTVEMVTKDACASGKKVVKQVKRTVHKNFGGKMIPETKRTTKVVCN